MSLPSLNTEQRFAEDEDVGLVPRDRIDECTQIRHIPDDVDVALPI